MRYDRARASLDRHATYNRRRLRRRRCLISKEEAAANPSAWQAQSQPGGGLASVGHRALRMP